MTERTCGFDRINKIDGILPAEKDNLDQTKILLIPLILSKLLRHALNTIQ